MFEIDSNISEPLGQIPRLLKLSEIKVRPE